MKGGIVYLVGAGPGDPGLITLRGLECLKLAHVVVYDRLVNPSLLAYARRAELIDVGKQPHRHTLPQAKINALLIEEAGAGKTVVRLKGGDPFVFGRGGEEATALAQAGLPFEIVPGVTSAIAAPAYAGIPVTHREMACSVAFATGHRADFINDPACDWGRLACSCDTLVFLMGVHNLPRIVEQLVAHGRPPDTPVALVEQATHTDQKTVVGTLSNIVERAAEIRPPAAIVVGEVVQLRESLRWFDVPDRRPLLGLRVLNTQPSSEAGELSQQLRALGAEPIELPTTQAVPVLDTGPLDDVINELRAIGSAFAARDRLAYDWIIFTSVNSASFFINRLFALGHDVRAMAGAKLGTTDRVTAESLLEYGLVADFLPIADSVLDLAAAVDDTPDRRILLLSSNTPPSNPLVTPDLRHLLHEQGALVREVAAYTTQPVEPDPMALSALLSYKVNVAVFTTPSSFTSLFEMLNSRSATDVLSSLTVACVNPPTAEAVNRLGIRVDLTAEAHTIEGLIDSLVKWRTEGRR